MAATLSPPRLLPSGDSAITVEFSRNIDDAANRRVLALDRAHGHASRSQASPRPCRPIARCWCITIPCRSISTRSAKSSSRSRNCRCRLRQNPALAHSRGLWRRARHRSRGRRKNAQHHARRDRGAACRRRLPRRHDRLYARLVLSQRARRIPAHAAAAEPAPADAGRHDLDRRRTDRRAVPRRPERLASAGADRGPHLPAASRSDLPAGAGRQRHALRRSMPRPSRSRIAPPKPARFIAEQIAS